MLNSFFNTESIAKFHQKIKSAQKFYSEKLIKELLTHNIFLLPILSKPQNRPLNL